MQKRGKMKTILESATALVRDYWLTLALVGGLVVAWFLLRTSGSGLASVEEFDRRISSGRPVVVELYSNT